MPNIHIEARPSFLFITLTRIPHDLQVNAIKANSIHYDPPSMFLPLVNGQVMLPFERGCPFTPAFEMINLHKIFIEPCLACALSASCLPKEQDAPSITHIFSTFLYEPQQLVSNYPITVSSTIISPCLMLFQCLPLLLQIHQLCDSTLVEEIIEGDNIDSCM